MWFKNQLTELFGIKYPIIQAPMAGASSPELAVAVCNAGGLGSLGCGIMGPDEVRRAAVALRARTNAPFNLNFFAHPKPSAADKTELAAVTAVLQPWYDKFGLGAVPELQPLSGPGFDENLAELVLELRPPVVSFHFGLPDRSFVTALRKAGVIVISSATTVAEALSLESSGVDAVIAQGWEAGGHRGSHVPNGPEDGVGTMALVPQIVDAVRLPVIASGGIADGRGIAACMALGACGVQMGTAFLLCPETLLTDRQREIVKKARDEDTMFTDAFTGRVARAAKNRFATELAHLSGRLPQFPTMRAFSQPLLSAGADPDEIGFYLYGQAASLSRDCPAGELMKSLIDETNQVLRKIAS